MNAHAFLSCLGIDDRTPPFLTRGKKEFTTREVRSAHHYEVILHMSELAVESD